MAVKGAAAKQEVAAVILSVFPGSFLYNDGKEIRVPVVEGGTPMQLKITLTKAASMVSNGSDNALPGQEETNEEVKNEVDSPPKSIEMTEEEKANVQKLAAALGL